MRTPKLGSGARVCVMGALGGSKALVVEDDDDDVMISSISIRLYQCARAQQQ